MFRVITKNSVYTVQPTEGGFIVERQASTYGRPVVDRKRHFTPGLDVCVGHPMVTSGLVTTTVLAILPA